MATWVKGSHSATMELKEIPPEKIQEIDNANSIRKKMKILKELNIPVGHIKSVEDVQERIQIHNKRARGEMRTPEQVNRNWVYFA